MAANGNAPPTGSAIDRFEINLEHDIDEQYQYEPGEILRGHVLLAVKAEVKVKAIDIQIKGEATVSWEEEGRNTTTFRADETYIEVTHNLVDTGSGSSQILEPGKHRFPLEYQLPENLPSSFIGKFGSITYVVKATLREDKKFGLSTMITSEPFLVLRKLDISKEAQLLQPIEQVASKRFWGALAFCLSGKVDATLKVNKSGHLPGEDIFMDAEIVNESPRIVKAVQACLIMNSTFHARHKTRYNTQIVNKKRDDWEMSYGEGRRWKNVRLTIPPYIPESRLDGCDIIDIRYELQFKIEISGGHEMKMSVPITVGTIQGAESVDRGGQGKGGPKMGAFITPTNDHTGDTTYEIPQELKDVDPEDMAVNMEQEEADKFRYPMEPGDTRRNPLFLNQSSNPDAGQDDGVNQMDDTNSDDGVNEPDGTNSDDGADPDEEDGPVYQEVEQL